MPLISAQDRADLDSRFTHHPPICPEAGTLFNLVRNELHNFAEFFTAICPTTREKSIALTKLEEAMFWANAAIARNQDDAVARYLKLPYAQTENAAKPAEKSNG